MASMAFSAFSALLVRTTGTMPISVMEDRISFCVICLYVIMRRGHLCLPRRHWWQRVVQGSRADGSLPYNGNRTLAHGSLDGRFALNRAARGNSRPRTSDPRLSPDAPVPPSG